MLFTFAAYEKSLIRHAARQPHTALWFLMLALWALSALYPQQAIFLVPCIVAFPLLGAIDARTQLLPDLLTIPLLILGLIMAPLAVGTTYLGAALGAIIGGLSFAALLLGFKAITKRDGMGWGDVKLMAALGAWVGLLGLIPLVLAACLLALLYNYITRTPKHARIPFGPFLLAGAWLAIFYQDVYWNLLLR